MYARYSDDKTFGLPRIHTAVNESRGSPNTLPSSSHKTVLSKETHGRPLTLAANLFKYGRMEQGGVWCFLVTVCVFACLSPVIGTKTDYKAAVYEHVVISPTDPEGNFTREEAFEWMSKNLDVFEQQVMRAAQQDVHIIVFPEYGITGFDQSRYSMLPFLEDIPDPEVQWNPCVDPQKYPNTLVLKTLSCLARTHLIYIVANMGDVKRCSVSNDKSCPADGRYQFNTNVAFDSNGTLIARYHKLNLYDESPLFDPAPEAEYSYFDTPFGRFGTIVCFDLLHHEPTQVLLNAHAGKNLIVTSAWNVFYPFVIATQMYAGISKRNGINVIASNIRHEEYVMAASGIFGNGISAASVPNFQSKDGVLLTLELSNDIMPENKEIKLKPIFQSLENVPFKNDTHKGTYDYGMNMTFAVLTEDARQAVVCTEDVCCVAEYQFLDHDTEELFIIGASDFAMTYPGKIHMQFCAVHRCLANNMSTCGKWVTTANSKFSSLKIQAFFDTSLVFPFVSTTPFQNLTIDFERESYNFDNDNAILESDSFEHPLLAAVVFNSVQTIENSQPVSGEIALTGSVFVVALPCAVVLITNI